MTKLHEICAQQAELFRDVSNLSAELSASAERKKLHEKEVRARIALSCRAEPKRFGIQKVTESTIEAVVDENEEVKRAALEAIQARELFLKASGLKDAFEHRKAMLKVEAQLYASNYWGEVSTRVDVSGRESLVNKVV